MKDMRDLFTLVEERNYPRSNGVKLIENIFSGQLSTSSAPSEGQEGKPWHQRALKQTEITV